MVEVFSQDSGVTGLAEERGLCPFANRGDLHHCFEDADPLTRCNRAVETGEGTTLLLVPHKVGVEASFERRGRALGFISGATK